MKKKNVITYIYISILCLLSSAMPNAFAASASERLSQAATSSWSSYLSPRTAIERVLNSWNSMSPGQRTTATAAALVAIGVPVGYAVWQRFQSYYGQPSAEQPILAQAYYSLSALEKNVLQPNLTTIRIGELINELANLNRNLQINSPDEYNAHKDRIGNMGQQLQNRIMERFNHIQREYHSSHIRAEQQENLKREVNDLLTYMHANVINMPGQKFVPTLQAQGNLLHLFIQNTESPKPYGSGIPSPEQYIHELDLSLKKQTFSKDNIDLINQAIQQLLDITQQLHHAGKLNNNIRAKIDDLHSRLLIYKYGIFQRQSVALTDPEEQSNLKNRILEEISIPLNGLAINNPSSKAIERRAQEIQVALERANPAILNMDRELSQIKQKAYSSGTSINTQGLLQELTTHIIPTFNSIKLKYKDRSHPIQWDIHSIGKEISQLQKYLEKTIAEQLLLESEKDERPRQEETEHQQAAEEARLHAEKEEIARREAEEKRLRDEERHKQEIAKELAIKRAAEDDRLKREQEIEDERKRKETEQQRIAEENRLKAEQEAKDKSEREQREKEKAVQAVQEEKVAEASQNKPKTPHEELQELKTKQLTLSREFYEPEISLDRKQKIITEMEAILTKTRDITEKNPESPIGKGFIDPLITSITKMNTNIQELEKSPTATTPKEGQPSAAATSSTSAQVDIPTQPLLPAASDITPAPTESTRAEQDIIKIEKLQNDITEKNKAFFKTIDVARKEEFLKEAEELFKELEQLPGAYVQVAQREIQQMQHQLSSLKKHKPKSTEENITRITESLKKREKERSEAKRQQSAAGMARGKIEAPIQIKRFKTSAEEQEERERYEQQRLSKLPTEERRLLEQEYAATSIGEKAKLREQRFKLAKRQPAATFQSSELELQQKLIEKQKELVQAQDNLNRMKQRQEGLKGQNISDNILTQNTAIDLIKGETEALKTKISAKKSESTIAIKNNTGNRITMGYMYGEKQNESLIEIPSGQTRYIAPDIITNFQLNDRTPRTIDIGSRQIAKIESFKPGKNIITIKAGWRGYYAEIESVP